MRGGDARIVLLTVPDEARARSIARALVEERLAACGNVLPIAASIYRWKGEVRDEPESLLLIKTTAARLDALSDRVGRLHSYTVPETIALTLDRGRESYLDWVDEVCGPSPKP